MEKIYVERDGGENPYEDPAVRKECEQSAADAEYESPVCEYGQPLDVCPDVIGLRVIEDAYSPAVGKDEPSGKKKCALRAIVIIRI